MKILQNLSAEGSSVCNALTLDGKLRTLMVGIVGKPNTGKTTLFSAATLVLAEIASYPFTTIKPNRGIGYVRVPCVCKEFNVKDNPVNSLWIGGGRVKF